MSTTTAAPPAAPPRRRTAWQVQRSVFVALLLREMRARVGNQWIGALWTLFEPLAHVLVMVAVMGMFRGAVLPGIEYPVFLATGLVPFFLFQNLAMRLMDGIEANRGLFSYRQVKPLDPLLSRSAVEVLMNSGVYVFTLVILAYAGYHVLPALPLEMLAAQVLTVLLGMGVGLVFAVLGHDRPRAKTLLRMLFLPLYMITGVIFPVDFLPRETLELLLWNPLLHLVELSRHAFVPAYVPVEGVNALYPTLCALGALWLGLALYRADRQRLLSS